MQEIVAPRHGNRVGEESDAAHEPLLTTRDLCAYLGISRSQLYVLIQRGEAPTSYRVGNLVRYDPLEVRAWLRRNAAGALA